LTPTYEIDVMLRAIALLVAERPDLDPRLDLYGRGDSDDALQALTADLGLGDRVTFHGRVPIDDVPARVAAADIGLAPTRHDPFTDLSLSTKVYEYAAMGKPVVASRLPLVERTFGPGTVFAYAPGDAAAAAAEIVHVADDASAREARVAATLEVVKAAAWERESVGYVALIDRISTGGPRPAR
jgi:glycosyltransferase involved in cell wall biosynthesis